MSPMKKREETYHMTEKEMARLTIANKLMEKAITVKKAAEILGLSTRQTLRIKKGVSLFGPQAAVHANRNKKPANTTEPNLKAMVVNLKKDKYADANFTHFTELLKEVEDITLSRPTVHRILRAAGIVSPRKKRKIKAHRTRARKDCPGLMVHLDASPYAWLGPDELSLHGSIDDASGKIMGLYLSKEECLEGYFEVTRYMIRQFGIPASTYSDRHTIFFSPKNKLSIEEQLEGKLKPFTQFSRAMAELGVSMIAAGSPQAKGRIERLWETLQDRLPVEFSINGVKTITDANEFLKGYIGKFNKKFAVKPKSDINCFRKLDGSINLDYILCIKEKRKLDSGSVFKYKGSYCQLTLNGKPATAIPKSYVSVLTGPRIGIKASYSGKVYNLVKIDMPQKAKLTKSKSIKSSKSKFHPWKTGKFNNGLAYDKSPKEIGEALFNSSLAWVPNNY
jgi:transposase